MNGTTAITPIHRAAITTWAAPAGSPAAIFLAPLLVSYDARNGATWTDTVGGNTGTPTAGVTWGASSWTTDGGGAWTFDGTTGRVEVDALATLFGIASATGGRPFAVAALVRATTTSSGVMCGFGNSAANSYVRFGFDGVHKNNGGAQGSLSLALATWTPIKSTEDTLIIFSVDQTARSVTGAASGTGGVVRLTVDSTFNYQVGQSLTMVAIGGTTEANGTHTVTAVVDATHVEINVTFVNAWTSGGYIQGAGFAFVNGQKYPMETGYDPTNTYINFAIGALFWEGSGFQFFKGTMRAFVLRDGAADDAWCGAAMAYMGRTDLLRIQYDMRGDSRLTDTEGGGVGAVQSIISFPSTADVARKAGQAVSLGSSYTAGFCAFGEGGMSLMDVNKPYGPPDGVTTYPNGEFQHNTLLDGIWGVTGNNQSVVGMAQVCVDENGVSVYDRWFMKVRLIFGVGFHEYEHQYTAAQILARLWEVLRQIRVQCPNDYLVVGTIPNGTFAGPSQATLDTVNAAILANYRAHADDYHEARDVRLVPGVSGYYTDNVHYSGTAVGGVVGRTVAASLISAALPRWRAGATAKWLATMLAGQR